MEIIRIYTCNRTYIVLLLTKTEITQSYGWHGINCSEQQCTLVPKFISVLDSSSVCGCVCVYVSAHGSSSMRVQCIYKREMGTETDRKR